MTMGDFRDANLSLLATPWRKFMGLFERGAERKRAEEALRAAERKYRDIFENALEGIFQTTPDGRFISANPALVKMFGFGSPEELIRERAEISNQHYVDPKRRDEFKRRMDEQGVVKGFELQAYRKDGSTIWLSENVRTVRDEVGKVLYYEGTAWDITEQRRANQSLRLFRTLIDRSSDAIEVVDPNTLRFLDCNESAYQDLGYSREEFLSLSVYDIDPLVDERMAARLTEEMDRSGFVIFESIHRCKDGSTFPVEINLKTVRLERDYRLAVVRDITERKVAEEALRNAERKYRDIFENAGEGIFQSTPDGRFIGANPALARMHGFASPEELIHSCQDISREVYVDPTRREEFKRQLEEQGAVRGFEHQLFRKDGSKIWISVNARAVRDEQGAIQYYEGTAQDVTQRKLVEKELGRSEEMYRGLVEQAPDAIFIASPNLHFIDLNARACELGGYTKDEILQMSVPDFMPPEDILSNPLRLKELQEGKTVVAERRLRRKDGTLVPVEVSAKILSDGRLQAIVRDITERKQAEAALQESEERFRQLSEAAFEAIILHDQGTILEVNQSFCRMYGYERAEVIGKSVLDLTLPEFREPLLQRVRSPGTRPYEGLALRKDGTIFRAELAGKPIHYQGRVVRVAAIRDITEQKRNERRQAAQYAVTRVLAESATLAEATPQLLKVICEGLRCKMGEFWRVCDSTNLLRCVETWHVPGLDATAFIEASRQTELAPGVGLPGRVWQSGQPAWIPDVMTDPGFACAAIAAKVGLRGAVAFPILLGNHTPGVMVFFSRRTPEVDEDLLKIMSAISSQIGQFTERKRAETRSEAFANLAQNLSGSMTPLEAGQIIARTAQDLFGWDSCTLDLYDAEHDVIHPMLNVDTIGGKQVDVTPFTSGWRPTPRGRRVIDHGPELILRKEPFVFDKDAVPFGDVSRPSAAIMTAPIRHASRVIGVLCIYSYSPLAYDDVAMGDLQALADHCGEALNRIQAEEQLRESEERYRDLVENSRELICTHDLDGLILSANRAATEVLGHDREDYFGKKNLREILTPEALEGFEDYLARIRNDGVASGTMLVQTSSGEHRIWEYYNTLRTEGVAAPIVRGMARDITDRKRTEHDLIKQKEILQQIVDHIPVMINFTDSNGRIKLVNREWQQTLGWSLEDILNTDLDVFAECYPDPQYRQEAWNFVAAATGEWGDFKTRTRDGSMIDTSWARVKLSDGTTIGIGQDITDRKRSEEALRESEESYRALFENARDAIYVHDLAGLYTSVNLAAERLSGYRRDEILGQPYYKFVAPEYLAYVRQRLANKLSQEGEETHYESEILTKDGRRVPVEIGTVLVYQNGVVVGVQGVARDITERKAAEEKLKANSEQLRALSARLQSAREEEGTRIAREIHDELGAALTSLKWNLEEIHKTMSTTIARSQLEVLRKKTKTMMALIDTTFTTVRRIASELRPSVLDDLGLVEAIEWQTQEFQSQTGIICHCDCSLEVVGLNQAQSTAIFRIFQEALTNILRHAQAAAVNVAIKEEAGGLVLTIRDNGRGIREDEKSGSRSLGLLGMRERAHLIGAKIDIAGAQGEGTVVTIRVPTSE